MRILLNVRKPDAPASMGYVHLISKLENINHNDWDNYDKYDVALFMSYKEDLQAIPFARSQSETLKIGIIDPRFDLDMDILSCIDFLVVDSIEMYDYFSKYGIPMFKYFEYPKINGKIKKHYKKNKIIIGYHGNKLHIAAMFPNITEAITHLSEKYDIELWLVYNINWHRKIKYMLPKNIKVRHFQWSPKVYNNVLSKVDIGIAPSLMPIHHLDKLKLKSSVLKKLFLDRKDDYLIKFKMPTNPGRIIVFSKLGIPVIADFYPSAVNLIKHNYNGMLAYSAAGWFHSLEALIKSHNLRKNLSENMAKTLIEDMHINDQNMNFVAFLNQIINRTTVVKVWVQNRGLFFEIKFKLKAIAEYFNTYLERVLKKII